MIRYIWGSGGTGKSSGLIKFLLENSHEYKKLYINLTDFNITKYKRATSNYDMEIKTFSPECYKDEFFEIVDEIRINAKAVSDDERVKTLLVFDEA